MSKCWISYFHYTKPSPIGERKSGSTWSNKNDNAHIDIKPVQQVFGNIVIINHICSYRWPVTCVPKSGFSQKLLLESMMNLLSWETLFHQCTVLDEFSFSIIFIKKSLHQNKYICRLNSMLLNILSYIKYSSDVFEHKQNSRLSQILLIF